MGTMDDTTSMWMEILMNFDIPFALGWAIGYVPLTYFSLFYTF